MPTLRESDRTRRELAFLRKQRAEIGRILKELDGNQQPLPLKYRLRYAALLAEIRQDVRKAKNELEYQEAVERMAKRTPAKKLMAWQKKIMEWGPDCDV